jgi:hypothetical protein
MQSFVSTVQGESKKSDAFCYSFEYQMYQFFFTHPVETKDCMQLT